MSKKDVIIISALINSGLLAVLFVTALKTDPEIAAETTTPIVAIREEPKEVLKEAFGGDEVDMVLKDYLPDVVEEIVVKGPAPVVKEEVIIPAGNVVEVVVKSGDALERIARANRTTVEAIRKASGLTNDRLKVGQVLKVPVGAATTEVKKVAAVEVKKTEEEPVYYVVKSGDNPWKIAKNHQVKFEDLLILNHLDEERAKNLKVGEKIRVR